MLNAKGSNANYWVAGLVHLPYLKTIKHNVSEIGPGLNLRRREGDTYSAGFLSSS
jgi:hypothetical protein